MESVAGESVDCIKCFYGKLIDEEALRAVAIPKVNDNAIIRRFRTTCILMNPLPLSIVQ